MNKLVGVIAFLLAIVLMLLGGVGLLKIVSSFTGGNVEQQQAGEAIFKVAFYSLFVLIGLKFGQYGSKKLAKKGCCRTCKRGPERSIWQYWY